MRKITLFAMIMLLSLFSLGSAADFTSVWYPMGDNHLVTFSTEVDSVDTLVSDTFTLTLYDNDSFSSYPIKCWSQATSTLGSPKLTAYVQGSWDKSTYTNVDTIFSASTSEAVALVDLDLNGNVYPYYRIYLLGVALNRSDTELDIKWLLYHR